MATTNPFAGDKPREQCGVFGIFGHEDAAAHTVLGLHALQHRGQEAAGIVTFDGSQFHSHRGLGQVGEQFSTEAVIGSVIGGQVAAAILASVTISATDVPAANAFTSVFWMSAAAALLAALAGALIVPRRRGRALSCQSSASPLSNSRSPRCLSPRP